MGRKGIGLPAAAVVSLVILLVTAVLIVLVYSLSSVGVKEGFSATFCVLSSAMRDKASYDVAFWEGHLIGELCETSVVTLSPPSDEDFYSLEKASCPSTLAKNATNVNATECIYEQIVKISTLCWSQRGKGALNPGSFTCYYACPTLNMELKVGVNNEASSTIKSPDNNPLVFGRTELLPLFDQNITSRSGDQVKYSSILPAKHVKVGEDSLEFGKFIKIEFEDDFEDEFDADAIHIINTGSAC